MAVPGPKTCQLWLICLLLSTVAHVHAGDDLSDFSNDLATDIGPLLALFGEAVTRQYLSESTAFVDYFIFAMAPIGILTAIVSVIRVCGHPSLRAFIGRSQEGDGTIEAELCTSTSRDVCELFNKGGITRVLGRPYILELVHVLPSGDAHDSPGSEELFLFRHYLEMRRDSETSPWAKMRSSMFGGDHSTNGARIISSSSLAPKPNLSLNVGIRKPPDWVVFSIAAVGFVFQAGVIVLAGVGVWVLGWNLNDAEDTSESSNYAPLMFITGTIVMCGGMWSCAALIGQTTQEVRYKRSTPWSKQQNRLIWLQPGPQVIGDQNFDSFAHFDSASDPLKVWTSSKKQFDERFETYTFFAVSAVLLGYIAQFIGLRGMKAWVSLSQLGITVVMSILRGLIRVQRLGRDANRLSKMPDLAAGHELDWLAFEVAQESTKERWSWWCITGEYAEGSEAGTESAEAVPTSQLDGDTGLLTTGNSKAAVTTEKGPGQVSICTRLLSIRERLSHLTGHDSFKRVGSGECQEWDDERVKVRETARRVSTAICQAVEAFFEKGPRRSDITLWVGTASGDTTRHSTESCGTQFVAIKLKPPPESTQTGWSIDSAKVEAILGLWIWSLFSDDRLGSEDDAGNKISLAGLLDVKRVISAGIDDDSGLHEADKQGEMDLWFGTSAVKLLETELVMDRHGGSSLVDLWKVSSDGRGYEMVPRGSTFDEELSKVRFCGSNIVIEALKTQASISSRNSHASTNQQPSLRVQYVPTSQNLLGICAQELFTALINSLKGLLSINPATVVESGGDVRLDSPIVSTLTKSFTENGLGSHADALACIVPALGHQIRPEPEHMLEALIEGAKGYRQKREWGRAETLMRWACQYFSPAGDSEGGSAASTIALSLTRFVRALRSTGELYRWSLTDDSTERRAFAISGIKRMADTYSSVGDRNEQIIDILQCYQIIGQRMIESPAGRDVRQGPAFKPREQLIEALRQRNRPETLFYLSVITAGYSGYFGHRELQPALPLAVRNDWEEVVGVLLEVKVDPDSQDELGRTAASYAAESGSVSYLKALMDLGAFLDRQDNENKTPLHWAAKDGQVTIADMILQSGQADHNRQDTYGRTPLWWAASNGHESIVRRLVDKGAAIDLRNWDAEGDYFPEVFGKRTPLLVAAMSGHEGIVRLLLENGAEIEPSNPADQTPLQLAAEKGHEGVVRLLLEEGASTELKKNSSSQTALSFAAEKGHAGIVRLLIEKGADLESKNRGGMTPLMLAARGGYVAVVEQLLAKRVDLESKDSFNSTALFWAARSGWDAIVKLLLDHGADPLSRNKRDPFEETLLVKAKAKRLSF